MQTFVDTVTIRQEQEDVAPTKKIQIIKHDDATYAFTIKKAKENYAANKDPYREMKKWFFSIFTFGIGGLYLWSTTNIVKDGEVALRRNARGEYILLPPGRHSNFPWEEYCDLQNTKISNALHKVETHKIFTVNNGHAARTYKNGQLIVFKEGQYIITDPSHTIPDPKDKPFLSTRVEMMTIENISATTIDYTHLNLEIEVQYQITDIDKAITIVHDITKTIRELASASVVQVMRHHRSNEFSIGSLDIKANTTDKERSGILETLQQQMNTILNQQYAEYGVDLKRIFIHKWDYKDSEQARELGASVIKNASIQARAQNIKLENQLKQEAAAGDKAVLEIQTEAEVSRIGALANAENKRLETLLTAINGASKEWLGVDENNKNSDTSKVSQRILSTVTMGNMKANTLLFFSDRDDNTQANPSGLPPIQLPPIMP